MGSEFVHEKIGRLGAWLFTGSLAIVVAVFAYQGAQAAKATPIIVGSIAGLAGVWLYFAVFWIAVALFAISVIQLFRS